MEECKFVGGPWDGQTFVVPDRPEFRVLIQTRPHWESADDPRPFRYGRYKKVYENGHALYHWDGLDPEPIAH